MPVSLLSRVVGRNPTLGGGVRSDARCDDVAEPLRRFRAAHTSSAGHFRAQSGWCRDPDVHRQRVSDGAALSWSHELDSADLDRRAGETGAIVGVELDAEVAAREMHLYRALAPTVRNRCGGRGDRARS